MIRKNLLALLIILSVLVFSFAVYAKYIKTELSFQPQNTKNKVELTLQESFQMVKSMEENISVNGISGEDVKKSNNGYSNIKYRSWVYFFVIISSIILFYIAILELRRLKDKNSV